MASGYYDIAESKLGEIKQWCREHGVNNAEIARRLGVHPSTLSRWISQHPELKKTIQEGRSDADELVADALFKRACGFTLREVYRQRLGNELITLRETCREIPPDTEACKFWLKNRCPNKWRDRQDHMISGDIRFDVIGPPAAEDGGGN